MVPEKGPGGLIKVSLWMLMVVSFLGVYTGCSGTGGAPEQDAVDVQLKWVHQAQFAGFYMAQKEGYYAEENLKVTLHEGGPDVDVLDRLASGEVDFAVYNPEELLVERSAGNPLVAIGVIYRRNPMAFVSLQGKGITRPSDLEGKSVALAPDAVVQFKALVRKMRLDPERIHMADYDYSYSSFLEGKVDVTEAYATGGMIRLRDKGYDLDVLWPEDYGIHFYADTIITTERMIQENPGIVTRFLKATLRGWREALGNAATALDVTMLYAAEADPDMQRQMLEASIPLVHSGREHPGCG